MRHAKLLIPGVREGGPVLVRRLRLVVLASLPVGLAGAAAVVGMVLMLLGGTGTKDTQMFISVGILAGGANVTPLLALWSTLRFGEFIRTVLHAPYPREGTGKDDLDLFVSDVVRSAKKRNR